MKKHNFPRWLSLSKPSLSKPAIILLSLLVTACKTVPKGTVVDPLDLLDNNSAFYISIPAQTDPDLVKKVLMFKVNGLSPKDADQIAKNVNNIYCGMNRSKKSTEYQITVDADVPLNLIPKAFNEKNGWSILKFKPADSANEYKIYSSPELDLSFPSDKIALIGRDTKGMLVKYDNISSIPADNSINDSGYSDLDFDMYDWLKNTGDEIHFYANKPQSFLTLLTGAQLDLKLFYVKGAFFIDPDFPDQYILNLDFLFKNEKYRKAGKTLLTIAFGLTDPQSITIDSDELKITGIKLQKQQLYKLFME